jgi:hypothetical protein
MNSVLYTLYEGDYHIGVGALVNSAIRNGFGGRIVVGYRGDIPPWTSQLTRVNERSFELCGVSITFDPVVTTRHLRFYKAEFGRRILESDHKVDVVVYCDPDIVFLSPWEFFLDWLECGVSLVIDSNFKSTDSSHPWRKEWLRLAATQGLNSNGRNDLPFVNSGFVGVRRKDSRIFEIWERLVDAFEHFGGDTITFERSNRWMAVTGDQDLLNAALAIWDGIPGIIGPEAMGFTGQFFLLSHAIESPKPWKKNFLKYSFQGCPPTQASRYFFENSTKPICLFPTNLKRLKWINYKLALLVSRVWRRP